MGLNVDRPMNFTLITGASKGIGKALAEAFAKEGKHLILTARSEDALALLSEQLSQTYGVTVHYYAVDLLKKDAVENLYEWCCVNKYVVEVLVNNAGFGQYGRFEEVALEDYLDMIYLNQSVLINMCYTFLPMLKELSRAHILNISSITATVPTPFLAVYAGTKSFVLQFSRALRQELVKTNINVTCSCPGVTDTGFYDHAGFMDKKEDFKNMQMTPEEVAKITVDRLYRHQAVVVPGITNKIGVMISKFLPSGMMAGLVAYALKPKKGKG